MNTAWSALQAAFDRQAERGRRVDFWWRDDDAVAPSAALDRLLAIAAARAVPLTLAVIPAETAQPLATRLAREALVQVAVHGWSHANYAQEDQKKQELGTHRPADEVIAELARGLCRLRELHGERALPLLVPPWNRIAPSLIGALPGAGFAILSTFGKPRPAPLKVLNSTVDLIDWHGSRGGRDPGALIAEITAQLEVEPRYPIGLLTHHLVHDERAWAFMERLLEMTVPHPACRWGDVSALAPPPPGAASGAATK